MVYSLSGKDARAPGRDEQYDTGLFVYNREDLSFDAMRARIGHPQRGWTDGDLFAVFRDDLGGLRVQYSTFGDFSGVAVTQLVRTRRGFENAEVDHRTLVYLVGLLMISRLHGYHFENFVQLLDHKGDQLFDFRGLCEWVAMNEALFLSDGDAIAEEMADDLEANREMYDEMSREAA